MARGLHGTARDLRIRANTASAWPINPSASDDSIAAQCVKLIRGDTEVLQYLGGVFAKLRDVRRDFVATQPRHFDSGTEDLDIVVIGDITVTNQIARGQFGVSSDFVNFSDRSAWDVIGEEQRYQVVALLRR